MDSAALSIVLTTLRMKDFHPEWSALDLLDHGMVGHHQSSPDFSDPPPEGADGTLDSRPRFESALDPTAPMGRLLRDAFASEFTDSDLDAYAQSGQDAPVRQAWHGKVIAAFAQRYRLWGAAASRRPWAEDFVEQLLRRWPACSPADAHAIARELGATHYGRSCSPEMVADDHVRSVEAEDIVARPDSVFVLAVDRAHQLQHPEAALAAVVAAAAVFRSAGVAPMRAKKSTMRVQDWWESGGVKEWEPKAEVGAAHAVWLEAHSAAVKAYRARSGNAKADPTLLIDFEDKLLLSHQTSSRDLQ